MTEVPSYTLTLEQLKSVAYDSLRMMRHYEQNLKKAEAEIMRREQAAATPKLREAMHEAAEADKPGNSPSFVESVG